jgi:hypothetical protein
MRKTLRSIARLGLLLSFAALSTPAQGKKAVILKAPFDFTLERETMPAGTYRILLEHGWLQIRSADGKTTSMVLTLPVSGKTVEGNGQVLFNRYGGQYFLEQVWLPEMETGRQTLESGAEREMSNRENKVAVVVKLDARSGR